MGYPPIFSSILCGYTLVVCEKPSAAKRISEALDEGGKPRPFNDLGVPYYTAVRQGEEIIVVSALGHLYSIAPSTKGKWNYPVYDFEWVPAYRAHKRGYRTRRFIDLIKDLSSGANKYVSACDYDNEGSLIAYNILRYICGPESLGKAKRMRYSTLTDRDLEQAWNGMMEHLDYHQIATGKARHEVDWLFGINLSRALILSVKRTTSQYRTLSIGRVQGPTLNIIKDREMEINKFIPVPFWIIKADTILDGEKYPLEYEEARVMREDKAKEVTSKCRDKEGVITEVNSKIVKKNPPTPFNLGDLQREAYGVFGFNPRTTLKAAEKLYLRAYISYPRTSSQRLPTSIDIRGILKRLSRREQYRDQAIEILSRPTIRPWNGSKSDLAHPAIYPTGNIPAKLGRVEYKIYDLICKRFLACLMEEAKIEYADAGVSVEGYRFSLRGRRVLEEGWMNAYIPYIRFKEFLLPDLREGMSIPITKIGYRRRYTKAPKRFNPSSAIKLMEDKGIGTKATRTDIIYTLQKRGYIKGSSFEMTELGFAVAEILNHYCPAILSIELTRELEKDLESINSGELEADIIVQKTIQRLIPILESFKFHEKEIGRHINEALKADSVKIILASCPACDTGKMYINRNNKTGKRFASCTNYKSGCKQTYSLPQRGVIKTTGCRCQSCGAPIIEVQIQGRRLERVCINYECPNKGGNREEEVISANQ